MNVENIVERVLAHLNYNEYISPEQAAKRLSVDPVTIRDWCHQGKIPFTKFGPKCLRIKMKDFLDFCKRHEC